jgi:hypothetical protein
MPDCVRRVAALTLATGRAAQRPANRDALTRRPRSPAGHARHRPRSPPAALATGRARHRPRPLSALQPAARSPGCRACSKRPTGLAMPVQPLHAGQTGCMPTWPAARGPDRLHAHLASYTARQATCMPTRAGCTPAKPAACPSGAAARPPSRLHVQVGRLHARQAGYVPAGAATYPPGRLRAGQVGYMPARPGACPPDRLRAAEAAARPPDRLHVRQTG